MLSPGVSLFSRFIVSCEVFTDFNTEAAEVSSYTSF